MYDPRLRDYLISFACGAAGGLAVIVAHALGAG